MARGVRVPPRFLRSRKWPARVDRRPVFRVADRYAAARAVSGVGVWRLSQINGGPDTIRTCDLCLRRAALYPAELRVQPDRGKYGSAQGRARRLSARLNPAAVPLPSAPGYAATRSR